MKILILFLLLASFSYAFTCPCGSSDAIKMSITEDAPYPPQGSTYYVCVKCGARCVDGYWCAAADYIKEYEKARKERIKKIRREKD